MPSLGHTIDINNPFIDNEWVANTKSLDFDGTGDYLRCGDLGDRLDAATQLCIKAWIKVDNRSSEQIILYKGDADDHIVLKINTSGKLVFSTTIGGDTSIATSGNAIDEAAWEHVSVNWYGAQGTDATRVVMSINGGSNETVVFTGDVADWDLTDDKLADGGANQLQIGYDGSATFSGLMNELCIWGNPVDITNWSAVINPLVTRAYLADSKDGFIRNFRTPHSTNDYWMPADIKLWLRFGDGGGDDATAGNKIHDQSSGGYHGTVSGNPAFSVDVPGASD